MSGFTHWMRVFGLSWKLIGVQMLTGAEDLADAHERIEFDGYHVIPAAIHGYEDRILFAR